MLNFVECFFNCGFCFVSICLLYLLCLGVQETAKLNSPVAATKDWRFPPEVLQGRYEFQKFLASGSYGDVCKARCVRTGQNVAVKNVRDVFENKIEAKRLLRELRILRVLTHDQIVRIVDIIPPTDLENFDTLYVKRFCVLVFVPAVSDVVWLLRNHRFSSKTTPTSGYRTCERTI